MELRVKTLAIFVALALCASLSAFSGAISTNTVWSDDVIITGDTYVEAGVTLTIDAGVTVSFPKVDQDNDGDGDTSFTINGRLLCNGTESDPVVFTSNEVDPAPYDWKGLKFNNDTSVYSNLTHTEVYYAGTGFDLRCKYITLNDCIAAYSDNNGVLLFDSNEGLCTINGMMIFENGTEGLNIFSDGNLSASGLVSSANGGDGLYNGSDNVTISDSKFISNAGHGMLIQSSPEFTNCEISYNGENGVEVTSGAPSFDYCTIKLNTDFGFCFRNNVTGTVTHSEIIDNGRPAFFVYDDALPTVNYCNIYGNGASTGSYLIEENVPSSSLYLTTEGTSTTYYTMLPVNMASSIHVSGYADHDYSSDDYYFYVYTSSGTQVYNYSHANSSYDTSFDTWASVSYNGDDQGLYIYLDVYSVYSYWGRVSGIRYDLSTMQYEMAIANPSGEVDAKYNWWGTINGVDDLVFQSIDGTVTYEGMQVEPIATAGCTLSNEAPIFTMAAPDSMIINPANYTIEWYDVDVDDDALVSLYYTTEMGVDGELIVADISEDAVNDTYNWDFAGVAHDIYYIYGVCDDGVNTPVMSYAPGRIQVGPLSAGTPMDAHGEAGESIQIPVEIINSWEYYGIISYQFTLTFDHTLLTATGVSTTGTLSEGWTVNYNADSPGQIQVNGFTTTALTTDGVLVNIDFDVAAGTPDFETSDLSFSEWIFNAGAATVVQNDGLFTVLNRYIVSGSVSYFSSALPVDDVLLHLDGVEADSTVSITGAYVFDPHLAGLYDLSATCDEAIPALTVTPYDASLTARYALGLVTFTSDEETAADVNGDGFPTVYDAALMAQYSVGLIDTFDAGDWVFNPPVHSFNMAGGPADIDFEAIVIGDPSANWPGGGEREIPAIWAQPVASRNQDNVGLTVCYDDLFYSFNAAVSYNADAVEFIEARLGDGLEGVQTAVNDEDSMVRACGFSSDQNLATDGAVTLVFHVLDESQLENAFNIEYITFDEQFGGYVETVDTDGGDVIPAITGLDSIYPNPFNPTTTVSFSLAEPQHVTIEVFNIRGQRVTTLVNEVREAGEHRITWSADGSASGVYFCRLQAGDKIDVQKMLLVK